MSSSVSGPVVMSIDRRRSGSVAVIEGAFRGRRNTQHPIQVGQLEYRDGLAVGRSDAQIPPACLAALRPESNAPSPEESMNSTH